MGNPTSNLRVSLQQRRSWCRVINNGVGCRADYRQDGSLGRSVPRRPAAMLARRHRVDARPRQLDHLRVLAPQCPGLITRFIRVALCTVVWTYRLSGTPAMQAMGAHQSGSFFGPDRPVLQVSGRSRQVVYRGEGRRSLGLEEGPCAVRETPVPPCPVHSERHPLPRQVPQSRRDLRNEAGADAARTGPERRILPQLSEAYPKDPRLDWPLGGERILCPRLCPAAAGCG